MRIEWYFDVISPFAWLQWPAVRELGAREPVVLKPVLFAGLLRHHGHKGPAEIPGKREFTYRHALWRARRAGIEMRFPPAHPFNPLHALRLCIAAGSDRAAVDAVLGWIWAEGRAGDSVEALRPLAARMGLEPLSERLAAADVQARLRQNFEDAVTAGVFGVPTLVIDGRCFWGEDATAMALEFLHDPRLFDDAEHRRLATLPIGARREGT